MRGYSPMFCYLIVFPCSPPPPSSFFLQCVRDSTFDIASSEFGRKQLGSNKLQVGGRNKFFPFFGIF